MEDSVGLEEAEEVGETDHTVEGLVQNGMLDCLKWFATRAGMGIIGVGAIPGRIFASESMPVKRRMAVSRFKPTDKAYQWGVSGEPGTLESDGWTSAIAVARVRRLHLETSNFGGLK
jgi:hypothetical protein